MQHPSFFNFLQRFVPLSESEYQTVLASSQLKTLDRKAFLLREGAVCDEFVFILSGCTRIFLSHRDREVDVWFGLPGALGSDIQSLITGRPSRFFIQAIRPMQYLSIAREPYERLLRDHRGWETCVRKIWEEALVHFVDRAISYQYLSAEERYSQLLREPQFVSAIPQKYLASYLGITHTSLSRVRRNRARKMALPNSQH